MSFREMIDAMLSAHGAGIDPATVLEQHGMGDLPPDALSSALLHFSERAPLDVADALAPVVTRFSPVPFEPDDLPPSEVDGVIDQGGDVFAVLAEVDLTTPPGLDGHLGDNDPGDFDHDDFGDHTDHVADGFGDHTDTGLTDGADGSSESGSADGFGAGHDQPSDFDDDLDGDDADGFDTRNPVDDALDAIDDFDQDAHLVPVDDTTDLDTPDDFDDTPDEPLHEGLEDLASSMSDMNVAIDHLSHDPALDHFDL